MTLQPRFSLQPILSYSFVVFILPNMNAKVKHYFNCLQFVHI
uniref:Uncharacterized protein n=1 Tax=Phage sp. ctGns7 TaxID=2828003 RepID=A0A8S5S9P8_9VIRU|nr:MAG TPA: hypothetical protein [Phage sp. ctGns7]